VRITWFSWKDIDHPQAGGAEVVSNQLRLHLVQDGHEVTLITACYPESKPQEKVQGVQVLRSGGRFGVYLKARRAYAKLSAQDLVIDEMNTIPFMSTFYAKGARTVLLTYQLARSVWFFQMVFPLSVIGYLLEPLYLRLLASRYKTVLTESESTKKDLMKYGFKPSHVHVFRVGMDDMHPKSLPSAPQTQQIVFLGSLRPMKRPIDAIKAFEVARDSQPELSLVMAGSVSGAYAQKVMAYANSSRHAEAIEIRGHISLSDKIQLLRDSSVILVTSVKEGWGLIVTEANSQGTPAIVYDTDGLRDSVVSGKTGVIVPSGDPTAMGSAVLELLSDTKTYLALREQCFEHSKQYTFTNSYHDFSSAIGVKNP